MFNRLLLTLRFDHSARCARGETFAIASTAMAAAKFMSRHRIDRARDMLLEKGLIIQVTPFMHTPAGWVGARYKLA